MFEAEIVTSMVVMANPPTFFD